MAVPRGNFNWMKDPMDRWLYSDAFNALEAVEGAWEWMATANPPADRGFMWWDDPMSRRIMGKLSDGHSGASAAVCMRAAQEMARLGWDAWVRQVSNP